MFQKWNFFKGMAHQYILNSDLSPRSKWSNSKNKPWLLTFTKNCSWLLAIFYVHAERRSEYRIYWSATPLFLRLKLNIWNDFKYIYNTKSKKMMCDNLWCSVMSVHHSVSIYIHYCLQHSHAEPVCFLNIGAFLLTKCYWFLHHPVWTFNFTGAACHLYKHCSWKLIQNSISRHFCKDISYWRRSVLNILTTS